MQKYIFHKKLNYLSLLMIAIGILGFFFSFGKTMGSTQTYAEELHNRPWAALYTVALFYLLMALGVLVFYCINRVTKSQWSKPLNDVMEGISAYIFWGSAVVGLILVLACLGYAKLFPWMEAVSSPTADVLKSKRAFLNPTGFMVRSGVYLLLWSAFRYYIRRTSLTYAHTLNVKYEQRLFKLSAGFLVVFFITESLSSWDWLMSLEPQWYSTLWAWYVLSSFFVSGIALLTIIVILLKKSSYLPEVGTAHLHDLAKYLFAFSIFWAYLWFSQFLLIWYANIPEEAIYFVPRLLGGYKGLLIATIVLGFAVPLVGLISSRAKARRGWVAAMAAVILVAHFLDFYLMVYPATVGSYWGFGMAEFSALLTITGVFMLVVCRAFRRGI